MNYRNNFDLWRKQKTREIGEERAKLTTQSMELEKDRQEAQAALKEIDDSVVMEDETQVYDTSYEEIEP